MPIFFALNRTTPGEQPDDLTLPVSAPTTTGTKIANFFDGWTSPVGDVFTFGTPGGQQKFSESNFDGRIAAKTDGSWRDAEVTTYGQSFQVLMRLTAAGKAFRFKYNANASGGAFTIDEVSGVNSALPIMVENTPANGAVVREIYDAAEGGGTMTTRFGSSGTDVVANYDVIWASGHEFTFGVNAFRIYVKFKGTLIIDLPYDGWTHMEAGQIAIAPTTGYGILDSSVDFQALTVLDSVADGIDNPSNFHDPDAPIVNAYDLGMRGLRQICSVGAASTTVTVEDASAFEGYEGEYFFIEAGTVEMVVAADEDNVGDGFLKQPYIPPVAASYLFGVEGDESEWIEGVYTVTILPGATQWRLTAPDAEVLGTEDIDNRINGKIYAHLMQGEIPFVAGDNFTITVTCIGETTTDTYDGLKAAGRQRTIGVGGKWPASDITVAQLAANENPDDLPNFSQAMITDGVDRGKTRFRGEFTWAEWSSTYHYGNRSQPRALKAQLVSVNVGANTIELDVAATAATAGVYIWHDAWYPLDRILGSDFAPYANVTVRMPEGHFGIGDAINLSGRDTWGIRGEGQGVTVLECARGIVGSSNGSLFLSECNDTYARDFDYVLQDDPMAGFTMSEPRGPSGNLDFAFPYGAKMQGCTNSWFDRITVYDCPSNAFEMAQCTACQIGGVLNPETDPDLWMTQRSMVEAHSQYPSQHYRGWRGAITASIGAIPCKISGMRLRHAYAYAGIECFLATNVVLEYLDFENGVINCNGSADAEYHDINSVFTKNSWPNGSVDIASTAMLQHNSNQPGSTAGTLTVTNCNFTQEGTFAETGDICRTIAVDSGTLVMRGTYDTTVADDGNRRGLIFRSNPFVDGTNAINDAAIIVADGGALDIEGYRIKGFPTTGWAYSIFSAATGAGGVRVVNNIMDNPPPASAVVTPVTGNVTNAAYDAL